MRLTKKMARTLDFDPYAGIKRPQIKRGRMQMSQPIQPSRARGVWRKEGGKFKNPIA